MNTTRGDSPYSGNFYSQQQQMYTQQYYQPATWQPMMYQPLMMHPYGLQQPSRHGYAPSPTCPSLYSLQQNSSLAHNKLIPSQVVPSRDNAPLYRQHQLQPAFQYQQPQRPADPWSSYGNTWGQQAAQQPLQQHSQQQYIDQTDQYSLRSAASQTSYADHQPQVDYQDPAFDPLKDLKLIPASASKIPAHPAIENSGVPLTDFAVELIWEICASAKEQALAMRDSRHQQSSYSEPSTPGQYGSIGGERAARRTKSNSPPSLDELYFSGPHSYLSSPESPAGPLTPPSSTMSTACPIPIQFQNGKVEFMSAAKELAPWTRDQYESRSAVTCSPSPDHQGASPTFKRFVKDLLTLTLVTPQVLLLAMLYVARIPQMTQEGGWNKFLAQGMAYKLVLGSLICANKHLDDNSFRCSTWATVSACPVADIAAAEAMVLKSLHFDLNVSAQEWAEWLHTLVERRARQNPSIEDVVLARLCTLVDEVEQAH